MNQIMPLVQNDFDGKLPVAILMLKAGIMQRLLETRIERQGNNFKVVAHTSKGYISNIIPLVSSCSEL